MSIHINKKRKQYFICYHAVDDATGKMKTFSVTNSKWTLDRGIKYMKSIEQEVIIEDKKKRKLKLSKGNNVILDELINMYDRTLNSQFKLQTCDNKRYIINKYIRTSFRVEKALNEAFTIYTVDKFYCDINSTGLGHKRRNEIFKLTRDLLSYACDRDYMSYEYVSKLKNLIKNVKGVKKPREKLMFWTNEEWDTFIKSFDDDDKFKMLFEVDYKCALRFGEVLALKWNDFDLKNKTLMIDESLDHHGNVGTPKNESSHATVSLSQKLCDMLVQYKKDTCGNDDDFIFFADKRTSRTTVVRVMKEHIEKSGVPTISFHGLRHSCASRMISAGCSVLLVSKHLRHSSTQETLNTYAHLFPKDTEGLMEKVFD